MADAVARGLGAAAGDAAGSRADRLAARRQTALVRRLGSRYAGVMVLPSKYQLTTTITASCSHHQQHIGKGMHGVRSLTVLPSTPAGSFFSPGVCMYGFTVLVPFQSPAPRETELVPAIKDTGFPTPLAVRMGATSSVKG